MKFPFLIKKNKLFVRYRGFWMNVNLEVAARGGGWKGLKTLISGINKCRKGNHSYHTIFYTRTLDSRIECKYCRIEKKNNNE